jgi:hypothetical protein
LEVAFAITVQLFDFLVKGILFQKWIVLLQLQTFWSILFVLGGDVATGTSQTGSLVLRALQNHLNPISFLSHFGKFIN